jgi:two-component system sensor histidine kinase CpxA
MRSVYAKILLWSVAILLFSSVLFLGINRATVYRSFTREGDLGGRLVRQMEEGRQAYEAGGKDRLALYLQTLVRNYPGFQYFLVSGGRDLITGEDRSRLLARTNSRWEILDLLGPLSVSTSSPGNQYAFIATVPSRQVSVRVYLPYYLVLLCAIVLLCWVLTFQFASPLNKLAEAVRRFGAGDLATRVHTLRRDEIGELARAFDQMANRIETLLTAERRLLQDISHELRSPLARLSFAAELARTSSDREGAALRVNKEIQRLTGLVENLLEVTRAEGDPGERNTDQVALDTVVREVVDDCGLEASARGCRLLLKGSQHLYLRADRELLRRAIENIVQNAIRHAPAGTSIEITLQATAANASISVRDYGPGVPAEALTNIFKPFFRLDHSRATASGGVGLGLAIAQRAIQVHNGQVWAENAEPGLRVCVALPVERAG